MLHPSTFAQYAGLRSRREPRERRRGADEAAVLIRAAAPADEPVLARLAALDERPELPRGERLIGELGGRVVAALDVCTGRAVADPFAPTSGVVELLGLRAAQVRR
ncbi:MAG: hypothetical protein AVDCRST_MAG67-2957 [uncultured Solirubrobacteraceae bacterium]|uniref:Uncharacterized protein n=1 Tax=uncultured Solirubrobacteraceae bacterium TaxID=1162706 RepID=A0A6J4T5Q2_9ACTN|nr:MAG: hypothetical protein AVDCRST_MAG67-2957 [uncultured Solirubrobacteraceae bacterium]